MKRKSDFGAAAIVLLGFAGTNADASWLSDITGVKIDVPAGRFSLSAQRPQDIPQMIQHLPRMRLTYF